MPESAAAPARVPAWHVMVLAAFAALYVWTAANLAGTPDTQRDMYFAQQLAACEYWPLSGPVIYNTMHVGPLWFYLLGLGMAVVPHPLTVPVIIALLCALKFPLAYVLGRRYAGPRGGFVFALATFAPGWGLFELAALTHTAAVQSALLFGAWCALRYHDAPGTGRAALLGLSAVLMFHAHPTLLLPGTLLVLWAVAAAPRWPVRIAHVGLVAAMGLASLAPMLVEQARNGYADLVTLAAYGERHGGWPPLAEIGALLVSLAAYGADYSARYWLELPNAARSLLMLIHLAGLVAGAAVAVFAADPAQRRIARLLLVLLPVQSVFVLLLRPVTPYWMVFAHLPMIAAIVATGLDALVARGGIPRVFAIGVLAVWSGWSAATYLALSSPPAVALVAVPEPEGHGLIDIVQRLRRGVRAPLVQLPLYDQYVITRPLCGPATLYAHYAEFIDQSLGVGLMARCGRKDQVHIGGAPVGDAWIGLREHAWQALGLAPAQWLGSRFGYRRADAVWSAGLASPPAVPGAFPLHPGLPVSPRDFSVTGTSAPGDVVVVSHRAGSYEPFDIRRVAVGKTVLEPVWRDTFTAIYRAPADGGSAAWTLDLHATPEWVDVVLLKAEP